MTGTELLAALEGEGFRVVRRSQRYVWLERGPDFLMLEAEGDVDEDVSAQILECARKPTA
jgi:hypothetical protein